MVYPLVQLLHSRCSAKTIQHRVGGAKVHYTLKSRFLVFVLIFVELEMFRLAGCLYAPVALQFEVFYQPFSSYM